MNKSKGNKLVLIMKFEKKILKKFKFQYIISYTLLSVLNEIIEKQ